MCYKKTRIEKLGLYDAARHAGYGVKKGSPLTPWTSSARTDVLFGGTSEAIEGLGKVCF